MATARAAVSQAERLADVAVAEDDDARRAFDKAQREYQAAEAALNSSGAHYLDDEMEQAEAAARKFKKAARQATKAAAARQEARTAASVAFASARTVVAEVRDAVSGAAEARRESESKARAEFEARRVRGEAAIGELDAVIQSADADLIAQWADDPAALDAAVAGLAQARDAMEREEFEEAAQRARALAEGVSAATSSGAAALAADERRSSIGDAVMDVLEELGFDVSYQAGSKEEPLRISGQTANADGRGDFDIEIPLDGEVDFEVTAQEGDGSCAGTVASLQERLAERGVQWNTTDWGHGHEPSGQQQGRRVREEVREQVRTRGGGTRDS